jgi:hypothetical protein
LKRLSLLKLKMSLTPTSGEFRDGKDFSFGEPPSDERDNEEEENDPTSVVNLLKDYQATRRQSLLAAKRRESSKSSLLLLQSTTAARTGRKIDFDSMNASKRSRLSSINQSSKVSRLDLDNLSVFRDTSIRGDSPKRVRNVL